MAENRIGSWRRESSSRDNGNGVPLRVLHLVDHLAVNGKITLLLNLVGCSEGELKHHVIAVHHGGLCQSALEQGGATVEVLGTRGLLHKLHVRSAILKRVRRFHPSVIVCWSGKTNLWGALVWTAGVPVVWTIHNVYVRFQSFREQAALRLSAFLSWYVPSQIVCCSTMVAELYGAVHGYRQDVMTVIENGVDERRFKRSSHARSALRHRLGIEEQAVVITIAGAFRSVLDKDFASFVAAAGKVHEKYPAVHFVMCGHGLTWTNAALLEWVEHSHVKRERLHLLGVCTDLAAVFGGTDIVVSSSRFEAFGLTIIEGMAAGAIPVCTDTGEMAQAAEGIGVVVPPGDYRRLADGICDVLGMDATRWRIRSAAAIRRAHERYGIGRMVHRYTTLFREITWGAPVTSSGSAKEGNGAVREDGGAAADVTPAGGPEITERPTRGKASGGR